MTKHELTEEKIAELWDTSRSWLTCYDCYDELIEPAKAAHRSFARAAYDLGKQSSDGFLPCTVDEIRKGDTVERTHTAIDGTTISAVGIAQYRDGGGEWRSRGGGWLTPSSAVVTYRRKPAPVQHPDPEKHPIILDKDGDAWSWNGSLYEPIGEVGVYSDPEDFGGNWRPAKVVADPEEN